MEPVSKKSTHSQECVDGACDTLLANTCQLTGSCFKRSDLSATDDSTTEDGARKTKRKTVEPVSNQLNLFS